MCCMLQIRITFILIYVQLDQQLNKLQTYNSVFDSSIMYRKPQILNWCDQRLLLSQRNFSKANRLERWECFNWITDVLMLKIITASMCNVELCAATYHKLGCAMAQAVRLWLGFTPRSVQWDLWWTKWHWDRFFSKFFGFPINIIPLWAPHFRKLKKIVLSLVHSFIRGWTTGP
jgi:hypothetical protein